MILPVYYKSIRLLFPRSSVVSCFRKMETHDIVNVLESIASTKLAESWDNVGLLVEPSTPHTVSQLMVTNDLTEPVLDEAISKKVNFILSYHPPIFVPLKRLTSKTWKERIIIKCLENRIAVFSPHTSTDIVSGGVNDWLLLAFDIITSRPVTPLICPRELQAQVTCASDDSTVLIEHLSSLGRVDQLTFSTAEGLDKKPLVCITSRIPEAAREQFSKLCGNKAIFINTISTTSSSEGSGRIGELTSAITLREAVEAVKLHLQLPHVRLAIGNGCNLDSAVRSVAVCAGSGGSVLKAARADLLLSGEMSHHEVLEHVAAARSVLLCEHTNTERGYLQRGLAPLLQAKLDQRAQFLQQQAGSVTVLSSLVDADPLTVY